MSGDLQVHGIIEKGARQDATSPAHQLVPFREFDVLVSDYTLCLDTANVPQDLLAAAAMDHHRILLAYCRDFALLPLRFGAVFSGTNALADTMHRHEETYAEALRALADQREYTVELLVETAQVVPNTPSKDGRAFLNNRRSLRDQRRSISQNRMDIVNELRAQVTAISTRAPQHGVPKPEKALDMSVLLSPEATQKLEDLALGIQKRAAALGLRLCIKGPWPAYHFAWPDNSPEAQYGA